MTTNVKEVEKRRKKKEKRKKGKIVSSTHFILKKKKKNAEKELDRSFLNSFLFLFSD